MLSAHVAAGLLLSSMIVAGTECSLSSNDPRAGCHAMGYTYAREIKVRARHALPAGYTTSVTFDHHDLVNRGHSQPSGDDVAVVYERHGKPERLHRVAEAVPGWDRSDTIVDFALPRAVGKGDELLAALCYGAAAPPPPLADPGQVYWYHSDFADPSALAADWRSYDVVPNALAWSIDAGTGTLYEAKDTSYLDSTPYIAGKLLLTARPLLAGAAVTYRYESTQDDLMAVGLCTEDTNNDGFYVGYNGGDLWFDIADASTPSGGLRGYWAGAGQTESTVASAPATGAWHEVSAAWTTSRTSLAIDGEGEHVWSAGPAASAHFCFAMGSMGETHIDDLIIREVVEPEPEITLGAADGS